MSINDERRCVAGIDGYGVLTVHVHFTRIQHRGDVLLDEVAHIQVGGLQSRQIVNWLYEELFVGDEVRIRVLDGGDFDEPDVRTGDVLQSYGELRQELDAQRDRLAAIGNVIPHRFQVFGNGKECCTAGLEYGVLNVLTTWVRRDSDTIEHLEGGKVDLSVGGLEKQIHLRWFNACVGVGDEITVRVLGPGPSDPPRRK